MIIGSLRHTYDQLSFSGGGLRCFWQGGALDQLKTAQTVAPERIAAASGGALSAACFVSGCGSQLIKVFERHVAEQDSNIDWNQVNDGVDGMTPHQQLYRDVVEEVLDDSACRTIADGPEFQVLLAGLPDHLPPMLGAIVTMLLYETDKAVRSTPHGRLAEAAGAREVRVDARRAARRGCLRDLVCTAATIPPVFDIRRWSRQPVIDAGTVDNAPLPEPDSGHTLILLSRSYRNLPDDPRRTYVYPSRHTPAEKIDFTDADALRATYEQGRSDMQELLRRRGA